MTKEKAKTGTTAPASPPPEFVRKAGRSSTEGRHIPLTFSLWVEIVRVNREINAEHRVSRGSNADSDAVAAKRDRLVALGLPPECMGLGVCRTGDGNSRTVLSLDTDRGIFVLEQGRDTPAHWDTLGYGWEKHEVLEKPRAEGTGDE